MNAVRKLFFGTTLRKRICACLFGFVLALFLVEIGCQLYAWRLGVNWETLKTNPDHYYQASANEVLVYELAKNFSLHKDNRRLAINGQGIRDDSNEIPEGKSKVAILGDSVVFGMGFSQEQTISELLQKELAETRKTVKVLNFGTPGYALRELCELLKVLNRAYRVDQVVYILNLNDFALRDTIYEGADNGLYRMYRRPWLKSPWFLGKAIYRMNKGSGLVSTRWYQWLFEGTKSRNLQFLSDMIAHASQNHIRLSVVILPAGCAYSDHGYQLTGIHREIGEFLKGSNVPCLDPVELFSKNARAYFDETDHLTYEGNQLMTRLIKEHLTQNLQTTGRYTERGQN